MHAPTAMHIPTAMRILTWQWHNLSHEGRKLLLQGPVQHLCALHGLGQVQATDVPAAKHNVVGLHHGQQRLEGDVDLFALKVANAEGGGLGQGPEEVGGLEAVLGVPGDPAVARFTG